LELGNSGFTLTLNFQLNFLLLFHWNFFPTLGWITFSSWFKELPWISPDYLPPSRKFFKKKGPFLIIKAFVKKGIGVILSLKFILY